MDVRHQVPHLVGIPGGGLAVLGEGKGFVVHTLQGVAGRLFVAMLAGQGVGLYPQRQPWVK